MFWGLVLEPGKRYSTEVDKSFHVSMASLDCASVKKDNEIHKIILETEDHESLLCSLSKEKGLFQQQLDLNFMTGDNITFECKGSGIVHLTGYSIPEEDDLDFEGEEEDGEEGKEEESEESETELPVSSSNQEKNKKVKLEKRKLEAPTPQQNKKKKTVGEEEDESDLESDDELDEEMESGEDEEMESESDEDEEAGSEEEESDNDDEEEEATAVPQQLTKKQQKQTNIVSPQNKQQTPGKANKANIVNGTTPNQQQSGKKDKKKGQTPQTPAQSQQTPKSKTPNSNELSTPKKKVFEGGVVVKDIKVGNGPPAKPGKMIEVYYTGKLKTNNKIFDSTKRGNPTFKFRLGRGEVIKGWDIGIQGMKVGGKREIICPPNVAYGPSGSAPTIPPNSTLVFEVELVSTK